jgi:hypothetical protein
MIALGILPDLHPDEPRQAPAALLHIWVDENAGSQ